MCCLILSNRGLAYFGVLVQLLVGLLIIPLITLMVAFALGPSKDGTGRDLSSSEIAFVAFYCVGVCSLGGLIFRGIRLESITLLYISIASLIIFQLTAGLVTILCWKLNDTTLQGQVLTLRISCLALSAISTIIYLIILICFTSHLRNKLTRPFGSEDEDFDF